MNISRFFGVGPVNTQTGASTAVDLRKDSNGAKSDGTAIILVIEDATFSVLSFNYPYTGAADISAKTFKAGIELVGVNRYTLATGTIVAYHSK